MYLETKGIQCFFVLNKTVVNRYELLISNLCFEIPEASKMYLIYEQGIATQQKRKFKTFEM